jgi:hypothetical protein
MGKPARAGIWKELMIRHGYSEVLCGHLKAVFLGNTDINAEVEVWRDLVLYTPDQQEFWEYFAQSCEGHDATNEIAN